MEEEKYYKRIEKVYCPYFKEYVYFTDIGLDHIKFKNKYTARTSKDQRIRLMLLPTAIKVLGDSHTLQGKTQKQRFEERYINSRKENTLTLVTYFEFIAIIDTRRVKVVLKQIEGGDKIFLSVIPFFKQKTPLESDDSL